MMGMHDSFRKSYASFLFNVKQLGCTMTPINMDTMIDALPSYYVIGSSEASSNLARYDGMNYGKQY